MKKGLYEIIVQDLSLGFKRFFDGDGLEVFHETADEVSPPGFLFQ